MLKKVIALILLSLFILNNGLLYSSQSLELATLLKEANQNNPDILAAKKRWESSKARIPQAKSLEDPTIGFTFEEAPKNPFNLNKTMSKDRMLSINQAIPFFGKLPLKGKIALVESQMMAGEYKDTQLKVLSEVKHAYHDLFMNYKEIALSEEGLLFLEDIAVNAEAKYTVGELEQEDLFKISLEIAKLKNNITNLKHKRGATETRLNTLLNRKPDASVAIPDVEEIVTFEPDPDYLYRLTLENQAELLIFSYAIEKNKYAKSLAKRSYLPDFMTGVVMRGITTGTIGPWDLMLAFSAPLWFWTKQRYEVKEAIANLEEAQAAYQGMKNKAIAEVKELAAKIAIAKNKINLYKNTQVPLLESSIEVSRSAYLTGKGDIMMLLDSERMLVETKMDYYNSLVDFHMGLAELERTIGIDLSERFDFAQRSSAKRPELEQPLIKLGDVSIRESKE